MKVACSVPRTEEQSRPYLTDKWGVYASLTLRRYANDASIVWMCIFTHLHCLCVHSLVNYT